MEYEETFGKLKFFVKTGIIVLSSLVLMVLGVQYIPSAIFVTNSATSINLPIYSVDQHKKLISLSFDSAGAHEDTAEILEILALHNVKATFFITGDWAYKYPDEVKEIAAAGHDIGNNSENHKDMTGLSKQEDIEEILQAHIKVKDLTGIEMNLFRPPYGDFNNTLIDVAGELGYTSVQWNIDSMDWKDYGVESIIKTVVNHNDLSNGSIILMHNGAKYTPKALEAVIVHLQEVGYSFVPVSKLIYKNNFYLDEKGRQFEKR